MARIFVLGGGLGGVSMAYELRKTLPKDAHVGVIAEREKAILAHVRRLFQLAEVQRRQDKNELRDMNLHKRLCNVESQLRTLQRNQGKR